MRILTRSKNTTTGEHAITLTCIITIFCRPSKDCINECSTGGSIADDDKGFVFLGHLISQLSGLQDLVWACGPNLPHSLLSTIAARGCRLHMHNFRLGSAIHSRDSPRSINLHDYALATAPSLFSIILRTSDYIFPNKLDYNREVVNRMVAGMAPNLAHLCLQYPSPASSCEAEQAISLGKPAWSGFFPSRTAYGDQVSMRGKLQSLVFTSCLGHSGIDYWSRLTDFTKLHCLLMPWRLENGLSLANIAQRGDFKKLNTLGLSRIEDETEQAQEALNRLLENLGPLQRLSLSGYLRPETFDGLLRIHGRALRNLSLYPYHDEDLRNPLVNFSRAVVERLAGQCPNLEHIWLPIKRTRGDHRETGIYRALSKLPRLERAFLMLHYTVGPNEEYWDEERDGEYPLPNSSPDDIPFVYLREAFSNSAIDANLALSIFNLISSGGCLRYLRLEPIRKMGRNAPGKNQWPFLDILRWFNRSWICRQDVRGRTTVGEVHRDETANAGLHWQYLFSDEEKGYSEEIYAEVFKDIWPQNTPEWWKDWTSLPLSLEVA